jgi:tetratricopeptide (TPR) repeat protein
LEKAEKINPNFKGLQTELAFSYNAINQYDKAETALVKSLEYDPKNCYSLKELAYANTNLNHLVKAKETFEKMALICSEKNFIQETAYNLAYEYYKIKDKINFEYWKKEAEKWSAEKNNITENLDKMEVDINK